MNLGGRTPNLTNLNLYNAHLPNCRVRHAYLTDGYSMIQYFKEHFRERSVLMLLLFEKV